MTERPEKWDGRLPSGITLMQALRELNERRIRQSSDLEVTPGARRYADALANHMIGRNPGVKGLGVGAMRKLDGIVQSDISAGNHEVKGK